MAFKAFSRFVSGCAVMTGLYSVPHCACSQLLQPVIVEYKTKASGKLMLTNNTATPLVVVLEPRSFSISPEGHGTFRPLDPGIHVELSSISVKLQPQEVYYVFYKASADTFPAWFTIYATFSQARHGKELDVRIQLPHTVYLYQKEALAKNEIEVGQTVYSPGKQQILCELKNTGLSLGRASNIKATGAHGASASVGGFPMLPGTTRRILIGWKEKEPPTTLQVEFEHFSLKPPIAMDSSSSVASTSPLPPTALAPSAPTEAKVQVPSSR